MLNIRTEEARKGLRKGTAVLCDRSTKWGNPFTHLDSRTRALFRVTTREEAVKAHAYWIRKQPELMATLDELRGKDLICWCAPQSCHCDNLLELANT